MFFVLHVHVLASIAHETKMFQVFQLTAVVIRVTATRDEKFVINLDRVAIKEEEVRGVLLCVQNFVQSAQFTESSFFSESGLTMVFESVANADSSHVKLRLCCMESCSDSIKARGANFGCSERGARRVCASCFACSWSSWAQQNSISPHIAEEKKLPEPRKVAG